MRDLVAAQQEPASGDVRQGGDPSGELERFGENEAFQVYDRQRNKFIKIENQTSASAGFFNDTLFTSGARVGKCFIYVTKPDANEKYGLHIYQLGQNTVKNVDDRCVRAAAGTTWPSGGKVLYDAPERTDTEGWMMGSDDDNPWHIYTYDVNTGEREVFLSHREIERFCQ